MTRDTTRQMSRIVWPTTVTMAGLLFLTSPTSAQEEACEALDACLFDECDDFNDSQCTDDCFDASTDAEAAERYRAVIACLVDSECPTDDFECQDERCGDTFIAIDEYCDFGGDEGEGAEACELVFACTEECDDLSCVQACGADAEDPEAGQAVAELVVCLVENQCEDEDDDCLFENCEAELDALFQVCDFDEDDDEEGGNFDEDDLGNDDTDPCSDDPGPDCCLFANDGECDEPDFCAPNTDTTDCRNNPNPSASGGEADGDVLDDESCATTLHAPPPQTPLLAVLAMGLLLLTRRPSKRRATTSTSD